jgi:hypothetical protein
VIFFKRPEPAAWLFYHRPFPYPASSFKKHYPITPQVDQAGGSIRSVITAILTQKQRFISLAPWLHRGAWAVKAEEESPLPERRPGLWGNGCRKNGGRPACFHLFKVKHHA